MKNAKKIAGILCIVVAVLMLAMLVMQFMPFWSAEEDTASINGYVWLPKSHKDLTNYFKDFFKNEIGIKYSMNYFYLMPVIVLVCCVLGLALCATKRGGLVSFILPLIGGIYGARDYLMNVLFQMGQNWQIHLALCIAMAVVAGLGIAVCILGKIKFKKKAAA